MGEVLNRFLGDESVSLPDTICVQLLHVHVELLQPFLFLSVFAQGYIVYFFRHLLHVYAIWAFSISIFVFFFWVSSFFVGLRVRKQL